MIRAKNIFYEAGRHHFALNTNNTSQIFFIDAYFTDSVLRTAQFGLKLESVAALIRKVPNFETWYYAVVQEDNVHVIDFEAQLLNLMENFCIQSQHANLLFNKMHKLLLQNKVVSSSDQKAYTNGVTIQSTNKTSKNSEDVGLVTGRGFNISKHWQKDCSKSNKE